VDFALRKDGRFIRLMHVCHSIDEPRTFKREARALIAAGRELGCRRLTILEWDREGMESIEGFKIEVRPLWKWFQGPVF
jgi:predicted AAA+ superfamily ATPase